MIVKHEDFDKAVRFHSIHVGDAFKVNKGDCYCIKVSGGQAFVYPKVSNVNAYLTVFDHDQEVIRLPNTEITFK